MSTGRLRKSCAVCAAERAATVSRVVQQQNRRSLSTYSHYESEVWSIRRYVLCPSVRLSVPPVTHRLVLHRLAISEVRDGLTWHTVKILRCRGFAAIQLIGTLLESAEGTFNSATVWTNEIGSYRCNRSHFGTRPRLWWTWTLWLDPCRRTPCSRRRRLP